MNEVNNDFSISVNRGLVAPVNHPDYNKGRVRIDINSINNYLIQIEGTDYQLDIEKYNKIKDYVLKEQDKLVYYSKLDSVPYEGGLSRGIRVKINDLSIIVDGQVHGEVADYCDTFIHYIVSIF
jgi:hypothetical protein